MFLQNQKAFKGIHQDKKLKFHDSSKFIRPHLIQFHVSGKQIHGHRPSLAKSCDGGQLYGSRSLCKYANSYNQMTFCRLNTILFRLI